MLFALPCVQLVLTTVVCTNRPLILLQLPFLSVVLFIDLRGYVPLSSFPHNHTPHPHYSLSKFNGHIPHPILLILSQSPWFSLALFLALPLSLSLSLFRSLSPSPSPLSRPPSHRSSAFLLFTLNQTIKQSSSFFSLLCFQMLFYLRRKEPLWRAGIWRVIVWMTCSTPSPHPAHNSRTVTKTTTIFFSMIVQVFE